MKGRVLGLVCVVACLVAAPMLAQEGHPLTGSWHGEWHSASGAKNPVMIYMKWDSKKIEGILNPAFLLRLVQSVPRPAGV